MIKIEVTNIHTTMMNQKGGGILCDHDTRFVSYVGNIVGTKGGERREPFFLLAKTRRTNWQGSCPPGVTGMPTTIVTGLNRQGCMSGCLHKQGIITA